MEGVTGMMARLSHMQRVAAGGSAMYRTRVFCSFVVVTPTVATKINEPRTQLALPACPNQQPLTNLELAGQSKIMGGRRSRFPRAVCWALLP